MNDKIDDFNNDNDNCGNINPQIKINEIKINENINKDIDENINENAICIINKMSFWRGEKQIFDDISLQIPRGEVVAIMGPSGSGKTTLMKLISAQLMPTSGTIITLGSNMATLSRRALLQKRMQMSMLFQSGALFSDMSVGENVAFPLREKTNLDEKLIALIVMMKLQCVGLRGAAQLMPSQLSGGMARRAALARAIACEPQLMIYDEPFTGQDPISLGMLARLVRELNDALGMTSLLVSHDVSEVAKIADRIILISGTKIIGNDTPQQLYASKDPFIEQFMHGKSNGPVAFHYAADDYLSALTAKALT